MALPSAAGVTYVIVLFLGSLTGTIVCLLPAAPLMWVAPTLYVRWTNAIESLYFTFGAAMIRWLLGVRLVVHGDSRSRTLGVGNHLVISNHRTRMDWMFLWLFFGGCRGPMLSTLRIVLKWPLKAVPGFGWGCQMFGFLFLHRKWAEDKSHMAQYQRLLQARRSPYALLLFPEGTDLSDENLGKSHAFADKAGLQRYEYVLHPRVTGWTELYSGLRSSLDSVVDLTLGYEGHIPSTEKAFITGKMPRVVHVHVRTYEPSQLPPAGDQKALDSWCRDRFADKEALLKRFYTEPSASSGGAGSGSAGSAAPGSSTARRPRASTAHGWGMPHAHGPPPGAYLRMGVFWVVVYAAMLASFYRWPALSCAYIVAAVVAHVVVTKAGGWDVMELRQHAGAQASGASR